MEKEISGLEWGQWLSHYPETHVLQTTEWGELKSRFGWKPRYLIGKEAGAMLLFKELPLGLKIGYIPKGPVGETWQELWPITDDVCRQERAIFLRIEPDLWEENTSLSLASLQKYAIYPVDPIQPRRTVILSLEGEEDAWLMRMKQKTRYNIRLSQKKGLRVVISKDIDAFAQLMQETGERDGFGVHTREYYQLAYELFSPQKRCELLIAEFDRKPLAGLMIFQRGRRAWFLFGGSGNEERNRMPAYLIQWEAMRWAARRGCKEYDLWGAPDFDEQYLEDNFQSRSDGLWGVYRFKRGFGGELRRSVGAWDRVFYQNIYRVYQWFMKIRKSKML